MTSGYNHFCWGLTTTVGCILSVLQILGWVLFFLKNNIRFPDRLGKGKCTELTVTCYYTELLIRQSYKEFVNTRFIIKDQPLIAFISWKM